jgi:thiamine biosynthesis lipoprotein
MTMMVTTVMTTMTMKAMTISPPAAPAWQWQVGNFRAMNSDVFLWYFGGPGGGGRGMVGQVEELFAHQEQRLSRFRPDSDLSLLNRDPASHCRISPELYAPLEIALWAAAQTGWIYDPTLLSELEAAGYDRSFEGIVERAAFQWPAPVATMAQRPVQALRSLLKEEIRFFASDQVVQRPAGLRFDLGGMGKGWTVDRAADLMNGAGPFLINAGGDLFAHGRPERGRGWAIRLEDPLDPQQTLATVYLDHHALATSAVTKRRWRSNGALRHHLIDPRTGEPAVTDALSVSVIAQRTVLAEIFATVALILGVEQGLAWLETLPGVEGYFCTTERTTVCTGGFGEFLDP